ncbi:MAG: nicotinate phosphoribosyltransferase [Alphaproteobacteria bacterium]|jgi:nicotinate phosphoribosyltransferase|nr:nicotinate phosphoribosyltransferase [Alphaproteobacteria bacterium]
MTTPNPWVNDRSIALFTDLYELTMMAAYVEEGMEADATFSLFVRRLPESRNYLLACGLADVLHYLETLRFDRESLDHLAGLGHFPDRFLRWLEDFRFTGSVRAMPEGTPFFANEPVLEVTAPLPQAQLAETFIMNQVHVQTVLASKAARVVQAAAGRPVVDFGPRRMHGTDAAIKAARAFHIAGVSGTSNVLASHIYGVPVSGTMAHSFIQAFDAESDAFKAFARLYPQTVLLVDTYDTLAGVDKVIAFANSLGEEFRVRAIRLDSGDLSALSKEARRRLDDAGLHSVGIFASSSLDESRIATLLADGAPIDGFGVGTKMGVSEDAPSLDIAYKLAGYAGRGRLKLSTGKPVLPGRKQVFRRYAGDRAVEDVIARNGEDLPGEPLLSPVMADGARLPEAETALDEIRDWCREQQDRLPERLRALAPADPPYPVHVSAALAGFQDSVREEITGAAR